jgi:uncharacterized protein YcgI (DUF1989 family)
MTTVKARGELQGDSCAGAAPRDPATAILDHVVPAERPWSGIVRAGQILRIVDSGGQHDTSAGACSCESNTVRFGHHTRYMHACRENFVLEVTRHGMSKRDVVPNINFFMNVPVAPSGDLAIVDGLSGPGDYVEMVAEMDVLCVISNCPQVNNPCNGFDPTPIQILIWDAPEV